jgi:PAS domain S-box-containing protein
MSADTPQATTDNAFYIQGRDRSKTRANVYIALTIALLVAYGMVWDSTWQGTAQLHTLMEVVATLLAAIVGALALIRYYAKKDATLLLVGAGFLGTAFLDGYHAVVTSSFFSEHFPSVLSSLIPWSWVASRLYLSILLWLSYIFWARRSKQGLPNQVSEPVVYSWVFVTTLGSFLFFAFVPLPRAYYPELFFHRPEEFVPAIFFALALAGYLKKGVWKFDTFEHWLVLSLIVGVIGQSVFMSFSGHLFDMMFDAAHTLKKVSYILVLAGLMISMYFLFRQVNENAEALRVSEKRVKAVVDNAIDGIITIDVRGVIETFNPAAEKIFGHKPADVIGQNVKILMPEPYHSEHDGHLETHARTGKNNIIGIGREVEGLHKNGGIFPMDLSVSEMFVGGKMFYVGIIRDITERKRIDRMKSEFISTVSHELRTPLTSIQGSLALVTKANDINIPEKHNRLLHIAHKNCHRLVRLINDMLDLEKIESGKIEFKFEDLDLLSLVAQSIEDNQSYAREFSVDLALVCDEKSVPVLADGDKILQVLTNLLSNAIKFSPKDGTVSVSISRIDGCFRVSVIDCGEGIPEEFRGHIFKRFSQADQSTTRKTVGTGLGLSIAKSIVEKHGGAISFKTETDKGTTFYFDLSDPYAVATKNVSKNLGEQRLLICDDDPDVAVILKEMLEQEGLCCDIASNLSQTRKMLKSTPYCAIMLDLSLPDGSGIAFIHELRESKETRSLPIIVVSATAEDGKAEANGDAIEVADWLQKPIDQDRLACAISQALLNPKNDRAKILHIEDDPDICHLVSSMVGHTATIDIAGTLDDARRKLNNSDYNMVLLDIGLPDGNGLDLLSELRGKNGDPVPVVLFTAQDVEEQVSRGVAATLIKSRTSVDKLVETITRIIDNPETTSPAQEPESHVPPPS